MMKFKLLAISLTLILGFSCTKVIEPDIVEFPQQLVVEAEFEAGVSRPVLNLRTTFDNTNAAFENHEFTNEMLVQVFVNDEDEPNDFRPIQDNRSLWKATSELMITEGNDYRLLIDAEVLGLNAQDAKTSVPVARNFNIAATENQKLDFDVSVQIEDEADGEFGYFHLVPHVVRSNGEIIKFTINEVDSGINAVIPLKHRHGILIDESILDDDKVFSFNLRITEIAGKEELKTPFVYFTLKTVTEDYFKYHNSINSQVINNASPFSLPQQTFTNFNNGFGLFAAYSTKLDSLAVE